MEQSAKYIFQKNLIFLSKYYPHLLQRIKKIKYIDFSIKRVENDFYIIYKDKVLKNIDALSSKRVQNLKDDIVIYDFIASYDDDVYNSFKKLPQTLKDKNSLINQASKLIIYGFVPFFHIESFLLLGIKNIYIVEANIDIFLMFLHLYDLEKFLSNAKSRGVNVEIFVDDRWENFYKFFMNNFYLPILTGETILAYYSDESDELKEFKTKIADSLKRHKLISGRYYFKREVENFVCNIKRDDLKVFKNSEVLKNKPVLVVGSGPSLENYLPLLKEIQDKVVLFVLSSAYRVLYKAGIKADYVFIVDPNISYDNITVFDGVDVNNLIFLSSIGVDCKLLKDAKETRVSLLGIFQPLLKNRIFKNNFYINTVLNLAMNLLFESGATDIGFIGIDLGTKDSKKLHADGYTLGKNRADEIGNKVTIECEGNFGGSFLSPIDFYRTKLTIEEMVRFYEKERRLNLFNFSDGVVIEGFKPSKEEDITLFFTDKDSINNLFDSSFDKFIPLWNDIGFIKTSLEILQNIIKSLKLKNYKKFQMYLNKFINKFYRFGNLHNIYYIRLLAKINFLLNLSKNPQKEFLKLPLKDISNQLEEFEDLLKKLLDIAKY